LLKIILLFNNETFKLTLQEPNKEDIIKNYPTPRLKEVLTRVAEKLSDNNNKEEIYHFLNVSYELFEPTSFTFTFKAS